MVKIKYAYCNYCQKEIHKPSQKPLDSMQKTIWVVICIATLGIGIIAFIIYNKSLKKKIYCPTCYSKLKFSSEPFEKPKELAEVLTSKQKVMAKVEKKKTGKTPQKKKVEKKEKEKEKKVKKLICPYCGEELEEKLATCPFCGEPIKV